MATHINRRLWLKKSSLLAGAATIAPALLQQLKASPLQQLSLSKTVSDIEFGKNAINLKARLFANENPFGPSEKAKQAITDSLTDCNRYAIQNIDDLAKKITDYEGLKENSVLISAGSSALLQAAACYYSRKAGTIITGSPSYEDLPEHVEAFGNNCIRVPVTVEYKLDLDAMEKAVTANTTLVYICNPNNPTATYVDNEKLKDFCRRVSKKTMVFVDEAYIDYMPDPKASTMISLINEGVNIIVARTFSKLYGFAGLRVGYAVTQPETVKLLEPYNSGLFSLSSPSLNAALATYQDKEYLSDALAKTIKSKEYLYKILETEGYEYIPSGANFVLFPIKMDGKRFTEEMMKRGVGVRNWKFNNKNWCRVSIGRMDEMEAFAGAFKELS